MGERTGAKDSFITVVLKHRLGVIVTNTNRITCRSNVVVNINSNGNKHHHSENNMSSVSGSDISTICCFRVRGTSRMRTERKSPNQRERRQSKLGD